MARRRRPPRAGALSELQPLKIAAQIATLQGLYYFAALVLMLFTTLVAGMPFSFDLILTWDRVRGDTTQGWLMAFVWLLDGGFCMSVAIVILIARSKLVPDFALTIHFLHLLLTSLYTRSLPRNSMWWLTMAASSAAAVGLGMWGCRYRELQPVFFLGGRILGSGTSGTGSSSNRNAAAGAGGGGGAAAREGGSSLPPDLEDGMGGSSSAGEYEMSRMKSSA
ncbi:integral Golgi membrane transport protein [Trichoderma citrinoviride]|uniref:Integral Golgi membrane transport protein n=1 Tax=Trichoderma citrinoviride TaxID=58853 RepID=A0A2T4AZB1_9HYPO|nr:integral Golgi membrane transport protein [Trichoderma citrinoviride]PTB62311.1 integral Golgi membrane transport protein [Trichoderma citrinoviride]